MYLIFPPFPIGPAAQLLFTTGSEIHGQVIESTNNRREFDVIKNESRITGVDYNPKTKILYLVDSQEKVVKRSYIPGSSGHKEAMIGSSQVIVTMTSKASTPLDVATDWLSGNIYWTEAKPGTFGNPRGSIFTRIFITGQSISEFLIKQKKN